jgi:hypothetical protein
MTLQAARHAGRFAPGQGTRAYRAGRPPSHAG